MENDVIIDIKAMIQHSEDDLSSSTFCIYRVPPMIRDLKEDAYTPTTISIGPFHYGNVRLQNMEKHKQILFKRFTQEAITSLEDLVNFVEHLEPMVRASYSGNIKLSEKELVKVLLVDAGFIIELFIRKIHKRQLRNDSILSQPWLASTIIKDLLLLENQLPFSFFKSLFNKAFPLHLRGDLPLFLELTYNFFDYFNIRKLEPNPIVRITNFTDLLRFFHLQRVKPPRLQCREARNHDLLYSANELLEAGVKFKTSPSKCLLDLMFTGQVLEVPQIIVDDNIETLFLNMIALEQRHYPYGSYFTDYAIVLGCLIKTNKDVDVLIHREIIMNYLGDTNDVAKVFSGLLKNVSRRDINSDYLDICKKLNGFYRDPWHNKKATLRRDYCKTPWQIAASVAGIVLLIFSLVQTIFSILQVVVK